MLPLTLVAVLMVVDVGLVTLELLVLRSEGTKSFGQTTRNFGIVAGSDLTSLIAGDWAMGDVNCAGDAGVGLIF